MAGNIDPDVALAIEALEARSEQRAVAARKGAQRVADMKDDGKDVRSTAVTLVLELAAAQTLSDLAAGLASGTLRIVPAHAVADPDAPGPEESDAADRPAPAAGAGVDSGGLGELGELGDQPIDDAAAAEVLESLTSADE